MLKGRCQNHLLGADGFFSGHTFSGRFWIHWTGIKHQRIRIRNKQNGKNKKVAILINSSKTRINSFFNAVVEYCVYDKGSESFTFKQQDYQMYWKIVQRGWNEGDADCQFNFELNLNPRNNPNPKIARLLLIHWQVGKLQQSSLAGGG